MKFILIFIFLYILNVQYIVCNERVNLAQNISYDDQVEDTVEYCYEDDVISKLLEIFTPDDYDEGKANIKSEFGSFNDTLKAMNRLGEYSRNVSQKMSDFTKRMNSRMSEILMTVNLPSDCMRSLARIVSAAKNGDLWALKFFEAQPRPSNGLLELSGLPFGNYDQCLSIESPAEENSPKIYGQYCGVELEPYFITDPQQYPREVFEGIGRGDSFMSKLSYNIMPNAMETHYRRSYEDWLALIGFFDSYINMNTKTLNGLCLPTTCSSSDVSKAINELTYPLTRIPFKMSDDCEYVEKPVYLNNYQIISIIGLSSVFVVFLLSSLIDSMPKTSMISKAVEKTSLEFYIKCFSFKRNAESVFGLKQYGKFKSLDGFRAILTFFVVLLHNYEAGTLMFFNKNHYLSAGYAMTQDYKNMFLPNILLMDNFFLVSAFLLCNTMLSKLEQSKGQFNYINYIVYRYLRVLPIILCGLFSTYLFELIGDGPIWFMVKLYFTGPCYDKWHKPLLMYNNILHYPKENSTVLSSIHCLTITWYSSCDFQLFALAPIVFILLYKYRKFGVISCLILFLLAVIYPLFNRFVMDWPHIYELFKHESYQKLMIGWGVHYWYPANYLQTYILGMLIAYVVRHKPNVYLGGRIGELFIWITTCFTTFALLYWQRSFIIPNYPFTALGGYELHFYLIFHKILYLSGFSWLIFACSTGRGGFINEILGWKGFKVIDNLTLEMYIMHTFTFVYRLGVRRDQFTYTDYYVWTSTAFDFVVSYVLSATVALVITRPFANMCIALMKGPPKKKTNESQSREIVGNNPMKLTFDSNFSIINEKDPKYLNIIHDSNEKIIYRL